MRYAQRQHAPSPRWSIAAFGVTILLSAFLLFQVQPLVSKAILPWFGGCPAVWTTCMLFFQVVLFAGYVYAHLLQRWLRPRRQAAVHLAVVVRRWRCCRSCRATDWKPADGSNPTWQILLLLTGTVGLPYFALSATSPLVQAWFSGAWPGRSPYRLYALSNFGSLAALLSYPFVFEPAFDLRTQSVLWSGAFVLYAALCAVSLVGLWRCSQDSSSDAMASASRLVPRGEAGVKRLTVLTPDLKSPGPHPSPLSKGRGLNDDLQRAHLARPFPLAGVAGVRVADAAGRHEPHLPGRGGGAVSVGDAAERSTCCRSSSASTTRAGTCAGFGRRRRSWR